MREGDWVLEPVDSSRLPKPGRAREEFVRAMEAWDAPAADAAIAAALPKHRGSRDDGGPLADGGAHDSSRNVGHKAIFTSAGWRIASGHWLGARRAGAAIARFRAA